MKRTANGRRAEWIPWVALLLLSPLVSAPAAAQVPKPLTIHGQLKDTDPLDRLRKQSHHRVHEVELKAEQVYLIELRSLDFDTFLRLEDAKGKALADNNDLAPGNTNSRLGFVLTTTAKYRLVVTSFEAWQTGEYVLQLWLLQPTAAAKTIEGKLTKESPQVNKRHTQVHKVQVQAERWYLIDLISKEFDPYFVLRDGQGQVLAQDDDSGGDLNARLLWFAEKKSEWLVQALAYTPGATGAYTLRWRPYQGPVQPDLTERERWAQQAGGWVRRSLDLYNAGKPAEAVVPAQQALLLYEKLYPKNQYPRGHSKLALGDVDYGPAVPNGYAALKGTRAELKQVAALAGKRELLTLAKDKASWDHLKETLPKVRYAHLATHGFFDAPALAQEYERQAKQRHDWKADQSTQETGFGVRSPLSYTGLVLAGANDPKRAADGVVLGEPLVDLPLEGLELCVLSACETGLGDFGLLAGEGVQGLPRAFHLAGCRNVVASLWSVNDQATAALMARFYHELWTNGKTPLEALRLAQLTIYRHPERIADLANRERPNFHQTVALPPDVTPQGAKRTPTRLWAAFQVSGVGH